MTDNQVHLLGWIQFYETIYSLDEVERPDDRIINDDEKCDTWYAWYRGKILASLKKYHKDMKSDHVQHEPPKPRRGFVFGGEK